MYLRKPLSMLHFVGSDALASPVAVNSLSVGPGNLPSPLLERVQIVGPSPRGYGNLPFLTGL